jgi:hypothetical protein
LNHASAIPPGFSIVCTASRRRRRWNAVAGRLTSRSTEGSVHDWAHLHRQVDKKQIAMVAKLTADHLTISAQEIV